MGDLLYCWGNAKFRVEEIQKALQLARAKDDIDDLTAELQMQRTLFDLIVTGETLVQDHMFMGR